MPRGKRIRHQEQKKKQTPKTHQEQKTRSKAGGERESNLDLVAGCIWGGLVRKVQAFDALPAALSGTDYTVHKPATDQDPRNN